jgi:transcriptional regulator with XRE-family HTH domain
MLAYASGMDGDELRRRRRALGLTQTELAELLEVYQATIGSWESGSRGIRHPRILELALQMLETERTLPAVPALPGDDPAPSTAEASAANEP